jgi:hypothetical protein
MKNKTTRYTLLALVSLTCAAFASEPGVIRARHKPGTEGHFRSHIQGRYTLRQGTIIRLTHVFGSVVRKVTNDRVLVSERIDRFERSQLALVSASDTNAVPVGQFSVHAMPDGFFTCKAESGADVMLPAYRIVPTLTLEQYMTIFSNKTKALPDIRLESLSRIRTEGAQQPDGAVTQVPAQSAAP